jgi:hypothetical protein
MHLPDRLPNEEGARVRWRSACVCAQVYTSPAPAVKRAGELHATADFEIETIDEDSAHPGAASSWRVTRECSMLKGGAELGVVHSWRVVPWPRGGGGQIEARISEVTILFEWVVKEDVRVKVREDDLGDMSERI